MPNFDLDGGEVTRVPLSLEGRKRLQRRRLLAVLITAAGVGAVAVPAVIALQQHKTHYSAATVVVIVCVAAVLILAGGIFQLWRLSQDLNEGTMSHYAGSWHERLVSARVNSGTLEVKLPAGRRLRGIDTKFYEEAKRDQVARDWEAARGIVDYATVSRLVIAVERQR